MPVVINGSTGISTPGITNSGAETIATTLAVTGAATLSSTASIAGNVTLGSSLLATPSGSAPSYTCRAWVNFNGTGTVAIRSSGNVSSITDNGTGTYTVNFSSALPDANFSGVCTSEGAYNGATTNASNTGAGDFSNNNTTTTFSLCVRGNGSTNTTYDVNYVGVAIFR